MQVGDLGFWQGAFRDRESAEFAAPRDAIHGRRRLTIEMLYGGWLVSVARLWNIERAAPG